MKTKKQYTRKLEEICPYLLEEFRLMYCVDNMCGSDCIESFSDKIYERLKKKKTNEITKIFLAINNIDWTKNAWTLNNIIGILFKECLRILQERNSELTIQFVIKDKSTITENMKLVSI